MSISKPHIGIFGRTNAGKSTIFNLLAGQNYAIVSQTAGTTTDTVRKVAELQSIGPVVLLDTGGIDDISILGGQRVEKSFNTAKQVDLAILVFSNDEFTDYEQNLTEMFEKLNTPFILLHNKEDIKKLSLSFPGREVLRFSAMNPNTAQIIGAIKKALTTNAPPKNMLEGIIKQQDLIFLVMPQDASAPEGRLILPQVQAIRAAIDLRAMALCLDKTELESAFKKYPSPDLVITDSQIFAEVTAIVPPQTPLTSFSILLARLRGKFQQMIDGTKTISKLKDGDEILILESCTHTVDHCVDIGRTKLPSLLKKFTGKNLKFTVIAGLDSMPQDISKFKIAIQCGGCMVTQKQLSNRLDTAIENNVPISNYGMAIAYCNGIFERVIKPFI